jgi:hypothetical protein
LLVLDDPEGWAPGGIRGVYGRGGGLCADIDVRPEG